MVKILKFEVQFSSPNGVFYSGQSLSGNVVVELSESMKLRAVKIRYLGQAQVSFPDQKSPTRIHSDSQTYFDASDIIFASSTVSGDSPILPAGRTALPFCFQLPNNLPSSFESKVGHVRYFCKAYLHRPWKFDHTAKKAFTVVSTVDLNQEPSAFAPAYHQIEKRFGLLDNMLSCVSGGLQIQVRLNRSAFVAGESIVLNAEVMNNSSERVKAVEAFVVQNVICNAKSGCRFFPGADKIGQISKPGILPRGAQVWNDEKLLIPPLPPSKLGGCKLITVDYILKFIVFVEGREAVMLCFPLTLGTIPLRLPSTLPRAPTTRQPSAPPIQDNEQCPGPPPSYEESVFMPSADIRDSDDNQHTYGDLTYRPLYPLYPSLDQFQNAHLSANGTHNKR